MRTFVGLLVLVLALMAFSGHRAESQPIDEPHDAARTGSVLDREAPACAWQPVLRTAVGGSTTVPVFPPSRSRHSYGVAARAVDPRRQAPLSADADSSPRAIPLLI